MTILDNELLEKILLEVLTSIHMMIPARTAMTTVKTRIGHPSKIDSKMTLDSSPSETLTRNAVPGVSMTGTNHEFSLQQIQPFHHKNIEFIR